jgi:hypothetical protein
MKNQKYTFLFFVLLFYNLHFTAFSNNYKINLKSIDLLFENAKEISIDQFTDLQNLIIKIPNQEKFEFNLENNILSSCFGLHHYSVITGNEVIFVGVFR